MTKDELRQALDDAGVTYDDRATKADLEELVAGIGTPADAGDRRPSHLTRRQARDWSTR